MKTNRNAELNENTTLEKNAETGNILNFSSTLEKLRNVDPNLIRQRIGSRDRNGNTHMVEYVEWHTVADILDDSAPNWGHEIKDLRAIGEIVTVTVAITIDGVTREGIGTGKAMSETGIKKAEHDALKRAAVKFGIARELYKKEFDSIDHDERPMATVQETRSFNDPVAKSLGDMVTAKQLGMIRAIGREADIDVDNECKELMRCSVEELSKRSASDLIEHLQTLARRPGTVQPMRRAS